jgi:hypothetical protein
MNPTQDNLFDSPKWTDPSDFLALCGDQRKRDESLSDDEVQKELAEVENEARRQNRQDVVAKIAAVRGDPAKARALLASDD